MLTIAGALASAEPKRMALLVGVNAYPFEAANQRLKGAGNDVGYMGLLTSYCGFKNKTLTETAAKRAAILQELKNLETQAGEGDQVLFYFTGRGSIDAKKPGGTGLSQTLVPIDGAAAASTGDISMSELEAWAARIEAKKATPIVITDCAYFVSGNPATRENRFYQNKPKALVRKGTPRGQLWKGPGIFISATDPTGNAFEWRVDPVTDKWRSAFTDLLVGRTLSRLKKGETPTYGDLTTFLQGYWRKDPSYMPKTRPALVGKGEEIAFAMAPGSRPAPTPQVEQQVQAEAQNFEKKRRILRIAIDADTSVMGEEERGNLVQKYTPAISTWLKANLDGVEVVPTGGDQPDRSLYLSMDSGKLNIRAVGDEITERDAVIGSGSDAAAAMAAANAKGSLGQYLQKQAYVQRIWNLVETNQPTLDESVKLVTAPSPTSPGKRISYHVTGPSNSYLYLFDQDDSDGIVEMMYPASWKREPTFEGDRVFPIQVADNTPAGHTFVRALVIVPSEGTTLPPLVTSQENFPAALLAHLKALIEGLANGSIKWRAADSKYQVTPG